MYRLNILPLPSKTKYYNASIMETLLQNETELQDLTNKLLKMSTYIDEEMVMKGALNARINYYTVKRYLNGNVKKLIVARKLVAFYEANIVNVSK